MGGRAEPSQAKPSRYIRPDVGHRWAMRHGWPASPLPEFTPGPLATRRIAPDGNSAYMSNEPPKVTITVRSCSNCHLAALAAVPSAVVAE